MAYGKIKADSIVYDNNGSDVETTIQTLTTPTPEGTVVKSTGETGTAKFLRVDGDGTCSWQVPPDTNTQLTLIDEDDMASNDATKPPSQQSVKAYVDTKAPTNNPTFTGTVNAAALTLSGNLTVNGTTTTVATTNTTITDNLLELNSGASSNANDAGILIERGSTGDNAIIAWDESAGRFTLGTTTATNDATGNISVSTGTLAANVVGNVTGDCSGYSGNCHGNSATASGLVSTPNITVGTVTASTVSDSKGDLRKVVDNDLTSAGAYTCVASDAGKSLWAINSVTVPGSTFSAGDAITIVANGVSVSIILTGITCYNAADASTGNRTLSARGIATILFATPGHAVISGTGLS